MESGYRVKVGESKSKDQLKSRNISNAAGRHGNMFLIHSESPKMQAKKLGCKTKQSMQATLIVLCISMLETSKNKFP